VPLLFSVLLSCAALPARAAPLPPEACAQLKGEFATLTAAGIPEQMQQASPAQARQLTVEQRADIARYIKVEQQLLFRCPRPPAPPEPNGGMAAVIDPNEQGEITEGSDIVLPKAAPKKPKPDGDGAAKPAKPAAKPATPKPAAAKTASADAPPPKPKPAPKPKANDAFVPAKPAPVPQ
jgi:hypothetical protein